MHTFRILVTALFVAVTVALGEGAAADLLLGGSVASAQDTCKQGYVWREAFDGDTVCVTPETRGQTLADNAQADARREPGGGAFGPNTCKQGYVWRVARPDDLVCVTPEERDRVATDNAQAPVLGAAADPGTHTLALDVGPLLRRSPVKYYTDTCNAGGPSPIFDPEAIVVGWGQVEVDGDPCLAGVNQAAVRFDTGPLDRIPNTIIDRAVLTYDEVPGADCYGAPCWRSGGGSPEDKPDGCVVVRIPSVDWTAAAPSGLIPYVTHPSGRPEVTRLRARGWDVTEPYRWQTVTGSMPLQAPGSPPLSRGFGFLLSGGPSLDDLTAEDNTFCASQLSNIRLYVTYTVTPGGQGPIVR